MMEPRQRSRKGCLTCRQKRKKCDEIRPICGRCRGGDDCIWPASQPTSKAASRPSRLPRIQPRPLLDPNPTDIYAPAETTPILAVGENRPIPNVHPHESNTDCLYGSSELAIESTHDFTPYPFVDFTAAAMDTSDPVLKLNNTLSAQTSSTFKTQEYPPDLKHGPPLLTLNSLTVTCTDNDNRGYTPDEDEEEAFRTTEWLPGTLQLLSLYIALELPNQERVRWSSALDSYFTFFIRYSYDPTKLPVYVSDLVARHCRVESVRLGILGTSVLLYSFLNPELSQAPLRKYANQLIDAAASKLQLEESQLSTTLDAQLAGISEILGFYYFVGDLGGYVRYIDRAWPIVQQLVGTAPVSVHKLHGPETVDIRMFAWCDVFSAIATSRPTRLVYDFNAGALLQRNQEGPNIPLLDSGLEWMCGLPDALLLLIIQIINLKHAPISQSERTIRAATIEAALRGWKVWPTNIPNSMMRVQRVGAQEIWRHFTILYLYQAIYKATPSQEVVQQSVKQIVKLASTLRSGHNPDCLLYIPYFLAGTFATSTKDRRKKCDEVKPVCGRCRDSNDCTWPASQPASEVASRPRLPRIHPRPSLDPKPTPLTGTGTPVSISGENNFSNLYPYGLNMGSLDMFAGVAIPSNPHSFILSPLVDFAPVVPNISDLPLELGISPPVPISDTFGNRERPLGLGCSLRPPPALSTLALACVSEDGPEHFLDDDEEEVFKPMEWLPGTSRLLSLHLFLEFSNQERVQWSSALDSYFTFYIRYSYDSSNLLTQASDLVAYHVQSESVRLAVLSTSLLFYTFLNPGFPQTSLREHAIEIIDAASVALEFEESQPNTSLDAQLAGVSGILIFYVSPPLRQAIYKATPSQEVVQQSVKQIIKLASTLRPGHNPDCLLYVPYFLAGTFAISGKDKRFIRDRLMRCGIDAYMKKLVDALEQLWSQQLPIDKHVDWTSRTPPLVF
ncbi:unnamed protein product [Rhizoctonia solani]|uniref:Zn(2)-C6 fungal-type domain-containing protein n=1 Tax=Rhizoctonia solani TaxID=456999 RepID=A0A8H3DJH7_9AGAM|nr:unnamed protein product [Rhizoctonia solani]